MLKQRPSGPLIPSLSYVRIACSTHFTSNNSSWPLPIWNVSGEP